MQSPWPEPSEWSQDLRSERLYYDGLRRIQEVIIDPLLPMSMALSGEGGGQLQSAANQVAFNADQPLDGAATPATLEHQALLGESMPATVTYLAREYVWGPGGWGVDELLVQYDQGRRASWPLQDAGGDVIALCDLGGTSGAARVITQIVYDAYRRVIGRDDPATPATGPPELRVGHKGLFFDRLDGGIADPLTGFEMPRLWPGARLSGYVRNRTLHGDFGRWNQPDPNATGLPVQASLSFHGGGLSASVQGYELQRHFGDGANVYAYLKSGPFRQSDPLGLMSTLELGGVSGIQGMLAAMMNGVASIGSSISGLMMSGGIWTVNTTMSGALVVGMNFDAIMMFAQNADANWNNWISEFSSRGSGDGPPYVLQSGGHTINESTRTALRMTQEQAKMAIEGLKKSIGQKSSSHSHKIWSNGDVTDSNTKAYLGNLFEHIH